MIKSISRQKIGELDPKVLIKLLEKYSKESSINKWDMGASSSRDISVQVQQGNAKLLSVGHETWVDCGTPDSLLLAAQMVKDGKLNPNPHR